MNETKYLRAREEANMHESKPHQYEYESHIRIARITDAKMLAQIAKYFHTSIIHRLSA